MRKARFRGRELDIGMLITRIRTYLEDKKFEVSIEYPSEYAPRWHVQASKTGKFRTISGTRRSTNISIEGDPNDFEIQLSTGELGKNLAVSSSIVAVPTFGLAIPVSATVVAAMGNRFTNDLWSHILQQIDLLSNNVVDVSSPTRNQPEERYFNTAMSMERQQPTYGNKYCGDCGNSVSENMRFCSHCGRKL